MTYAQQELEAEYNGRIDYMRELAITEAAELPGYDYEAEARQDATAQLELDFARLLGTLDTEAFYKLEAWVNAQLPEDKPFDDNADEIVQGEQEPPAQEVNWNRGDFICSDCDRSFFAPHEGLFLDPEDEEAVRCVDCHITRLVAIPSVQ